MFDYGEQTSGTRHPTMVAAAIGLLAVGYLVSFAIRLSSGWLGKEAAKSRRPNQSASTAHGIAVAAAVFVIGLMCALLVLALAMWRGSRPAEYAATVIVVAVAILAVAGASRRPPTITGWATVAIDLAVVAITGIGLRIYHRGPT